MKTNTKELELEIGRLRDSISRLSIQVTSIREAITRLELLSNRYTGESVNGASSEIKVFY